MKKEEIQQNKIKVTSKPRLVIGMSPQHLSNNGILFSSRFHHHLSFVNIRMCMFVSQNFQCAVNFDLTKMHFHLLKRFVFPLASCFLCLFILIN